MRRVNLLPLILLAPLAASPALGETITLSNGRSIDTPPAAQLDCNQLSEKLSEIDGTGYRGTSPTPRNAADQPLLAYEEDVATVFYQKCVIRALGNETSSAAFTEGYRGKN